ncbi:tautomerase family protein [Symbioplanes lichenis]|uniref:tautomerase family protein n=1 Tax=Symbioplanes lichenis TaxID=1629072 RepID=UPI002739C4A8|nr:tautomerase family protein [Actinoplanes lichenis]
MPHLTVHALETDLTGREPELIAALTDATVEVYGEWARELVVVHLIGLPPQRWGIGGKIAEAPAPTVTFGVRAAVFDRPDAAAITGRLIAGITDAIAATVGERVRPGVTVELIASPAERTGIGGVVAA